MSAAKFDGRAVGDRLTIEGYAHVQWVQDFRSSAWPRYGFVLRRGRLQARYDFTDQVQTKLEIGCDNLKLEMKDAYIAYRVGRPLRLVAGLQKVPFSREELTSNSRLLMIERSQANDWFGDRGFLGRDIGLCADGEFGPGGVKLGYVLGAFNGNRARAARDDNDAKQFAERVTVDPAGWLSIGLNATQRNDSLTGKLVGAYGGDAVATFGPVTVALEALAGDADTATTMLGAWLAVSARLGAFEPALRLERFAADAAASDAALTLTSGVNWYLHRRVRLKANLVSRFENGPGAGHAVVVEAQAGF